MAKQTEFFGDCTSDHAKEHFFYSLSTLQIFLNGFHVLTVYFSYQTKQIKFMQQY